MKYTQVRIFNRKYDCVKEEDDISEINIFLKEVKDLVDIQTFSNDILVIYNLDNQQNLGLSKQKWEEEFDDLMANIDPVACIPNTEPLKHFIKNLLNK